MLKGLQDIKMLNGKEFTNKILEFVYIVRDDYEIIGVYNDKTRAEDELTKHLMAQYPKEDWNNIEVRDGTSEEKGSDDVVCKFTITHKDKNDNYEIVKFEIK